MDNFWFRLSGFLPKKLIFQCGVRMWLYAVWPYTIQRLPKITMSEVMNRWGHDFLGKQEWEVHDVVEETHN